MLAIPAATTISRYVIAARNLLMRCEALTFIRYELLEPLHNLHHRDASPISPGVTRQSRCDFQLVARACYQRRLDLGFHRFQVEARAALHRRESIAVCRLAAPSTGRREPRLRWHIRPYHRCDDRTAGDDRSIGACAPGSVDSAGANDRVCFAYEAECRQENQKSGRYFDHCQFLLKSQKMNAGHSRCNNSSNAASSYLLQRRCDPGALEDGWIVLEGGSTRPRRLL
jgi:hypothetical protein